MELRFEGVAVYSVADADEATHFFEHVLGLRPIGEEGELRFYGLNEVATLAVDIRGTEVGQPPYLVFSADDITAAAEHFLERGCVIRELPWATGAGFLARSQEGHTVAVVAAEALEGE